MYILFDVVFDFMLFILIYLVINMIFWSLMFWLVKFISFIGILLLDIFIIFDVINRL